MTVEVGTHTPFFFCTTSEISDLFSVLHINQGNGKPPMEEVIEIVAAVNSKGERNDFAQDVAGIDDANKGSTGRGKEGSGGDKMKRKREELDGGVGAEGVAQNSGRDERLTRYLEWAGTHYIHRPGNVDRLTFHIYFAVQIALEMHREEKKHFKTQSLTFLILLNSVLGCGNAKERCSSYCKTFGL